MMTGCRSRGTVRVRERWPLCSSNDVNRWPIAVHTRQDETGGAPAPETAARRHNLQVRAGRRTADGREEDGEESRGGKKQVYSAM